MVLLSESLVSQAEDLIAAGDTVCRPPSLRGQGRSIAGIATD